MKRLLGTIVAALAALAIVLGLPAQALAQDATSYAHSRKESQNGVTFTVQWNDAPAGQATAFHVTAANGSGNYKARMDVPSYWDVDDKYQGNVCDPTRGPLLNYSDFTDGGSADFTFEFTASGIYRMYFYFMDPDTGVQYLRTPVAVTVDDPARPAVSQIVADAVAQCRRETDGSEYAMALWLHDWTLDQLEYDRSLNFCSAESGLTRHTGTCESYQRIYEKLLDAAGIANGRIVGNGHTWNAVRIDGEWCQMDLTWDDSPSTYGDLEQRHLYFGLTDELMAIAHSDHTNNYQAEDYAYRSTAPTNNYYVRNGKTAEWAAAYSSRIQQHLNAGETSFEIDADNSYDPPSINGIQNGLIAWQMNQMDWQTASAKVDLTAESVVTTISSTAWTAKFVFTATYHEGYYDLSAYKRGSDDASAWTHPERDGFAFAGWYADEACTEPSTATSGRAWARFVPISSLIAGAGPSLLKDDKASGGYDSSYLRFSYEFRVPSNSRRLDMGWNWSASWLNKTGTLRNPKYWLRSDNALLSNIVARVERANYNSPILVTGWISYETPDGTLVTAHETSARQGTIVSAASGILAGGAASDSDRAYARGVLGDIAAETTSAPLDNSTISHLDVSAYKSSSDVTQWLAPLKDGYAFAGWYTDENCTEPYVATTGYAYARFVPVSALVVGEGPSLCKDPGAGDGYDSTVMRFSYEFSVPSGSLRQSAGWNWTSEWSESGGTVLASKYWLRSDNALLANATARVERTNYAAKLSLCGWVSYVTPDGTAVTACEVQPHQGSAKSAAMGVCSGGAASDGDRAYASGILGLI